MTELSWADCSECGVRATLLDGPDEVGAEALRPAYDHDSHGWQYTQVTP